LEIKLLDNRFEGFSGVAVIADPVMSKSAVVMGHCFVLFVVQLHIFNAF
jgi:hypothetical protein